MKAATTKQMVTGVAIAILSLLLVGYGCSTVCSWTYSNGERSGVVVKFSHKGFPLRTWEGELAMGGMVTGGTPIVWQFSVDDPAVIEKIKSAARSGQRVTLEYRQQVMTQSWKGKTPYFVTNVLTTN